MTRSFRITAPFGVALAFALLVPGSADAGEPSTPAATPPDAAPAAEPTATEVPGAAEPAAAPVATTPTASPDDASAATEEPAEEPTEEEVDEGGGFDLSRYVQLHGFGTWAAGFSVNNRYLLGSTEGEFDYFHFALSLSANPVDPLRIVVQASFSHEFDEFEVRLPLAFVEWSFTDAVKLRLGKMRQPFGIYADIAEVGTLRPFLTLPQSTHGANGFIGRSLLGGALTGSYADEHGWGFEYDVYFGQLDLIVEPELVRDEVAATMNPALDLAGPPVDRTLTYATGARLTVTTPSPVRFGVSGYLGLDKGAPPGMSEGEMAGYWTVGPFFEYVDDVWSARFEFLASQQRSGLIGMALLAELAVRPIPDLQLAARTDYLDFASASDAVASAEKNNWRHQEIAFGINYWFNQNFVLKLSYHLGVGHLVAESETELAPGQEPAKWTHLVGFGVNFAF